MAVVAGARAGLYGTERPWVLFSSHNMLFPNQEPGPCSSQDTQKVEPTNPSSLEIKLLLSYLKTNDHSARIIWGTLNVLSARDTKVPAAGEKKWSKSIQRHSRRWERRTPPMPSAHPLCPPLAGNYPEELQADVNLYYTGGRGFLTSGELELLCARAKPNAGAVTILVICCCGLNTESPPQARVFGHINP